MNTDVIKQKWLVTRDTVTLSSMKLTTAVLQQGFQTGSSGATVALHLLISSFPREVKIKLLLSQWEKLLTSLHKSQTFCHSVTSTCPTINATYNMKKK